MESELQAIYDSRDSFYGKAKVETEPNGQMKLWSYGTHVATIHNGKSIINGWFSQTTGRHINEFLLQNGFKTLSKKEMEQ